MQSGITLWCNRLIKAGFYLLFSFVPLLLTPWNYELFEYIKMMAVYAITVIVATAWLVKMVKEGEFRIARTPLDIPIWLFTASQLVSTVFSIDPHVSWLGYYSRFNGGMWSILSYVLLYYAYTSNLANWPHRTHLLKAALISAALVALYGVLERLGIDKHLWVQDVQNRVFSTLGQPNWLAAYLVALVPISMAFTYNKLSEHSKNPLRIILPVTVTLLFFIVLLFTRSRSGLFGFIVADVVFWGLILIRPGLSRLKGQALILHVVFALIIFINGTGSATLDRFVTFHGLRSLVTNAATRQSDKLSDTATPSAEVAGPALEVGGTESGVIRKYVWQAAINAWASSVKTQLIGTGTETFAFAFYEFRPIAHNQTSEWDFLYNKAHNEYLNYLTTTGLFGLGSYLIFLGSFIWWFASRVYREWLSIHRKKNGSRNIHSELSVIHYALFAGWVSLLITNFFGFSVVILQVFLFLFPAMIFASEPGSVKTAIKTIRLPGWIIWILVLGGITGLIRVGSFWYADTLYAKGYRLVRSGLFGQAIPAFSSAIRLNGNEPAYHDELGSAYATLAVAAFEGGNATQAAQLTTLAIDESIKAVNTSPSNVNFYKTRTKVYYTLSALEPTLNAKAVESLEHAIILSPNDPKIYYNLAILVGREGQSEKAIEYLEKAKILKPNYRDAYYALWVFFTEEKKLSEAKAILQEYVTSIDPSDKDFLERIQ